jgi:hypothetical protein
MTLRSKKNQKTPFNAAAKAQHSREALCSAYLYIYLRTYQHRKQASLLTLKESSPTLMHEEPPPLSTCSIIISPACLVT